MKALVTGAGGQLGRALVAALPTAVTLEVRPHALLDVADAAAVGRVFAAVGPDVVINAAAFTGVDAAESAAAEAERVNADGPAALASACRDSGAHLVHVSTDYVFDGSRPVMWSPSDEPRPLNVYGATKLRGEVRVRELLPAASCIVRSSWLYAAEGRNFLTRMLELAATRPRLTVVADQIGAPTAASGFASVLWALATRRAAGVFHWCDAGVASWYDFAVAAIEEGTAQGLVARAPEIIPVTTEDYPVAARRPRFSLLDTRETRSLLGREALHWRTNVKATVAVIAAARRGAGP
jgi:dTDP-4-dehydrorhamnose reductase